MPGGTANVRRHREDVPWMRGGCGLLERRLRRTNVGGMIPRLKDAASGDFHLESDSPAIDRGDPAVMISVDYEGVSRPQGAKVDSGALEYRP
jgi:hypothetical protein